MYKIKIDLSSILVRYLKRSIKFIALNAFRASLIILGYAFHLIGVLAEWGLLITAFVAQHVNVYFPDVIIKNDESEPDFEQKFTQHQISELAESIKPDAKIKDIEDQLGISYRQARKIKQAAKAPLSIRNYTFQDNPA